MPQITVTPHTLPFQHVYHVEKSDSDKNVLEANQTKKQQQQHWKEKDKIETDLHATSNLILRLEKEVLLFFSVPVIIKAIFVFS